MKHIRVLLAIFLLFGLIVHLNSNLASVAAQQKSESLTGIWECWNDGTYDPCHIPLYSVVMFSDSDGWAVGSKGRIAHWDGSAWSVYPSPTSNYLNVVDGITADDVWALGGYGIILHWDGTSWATVASPTSSEFLSVSIVSSTNAWAVTYNGIYHWDGVEWGSIFTPSTNFRAISMVPGSNGLEGWAVGPSGSILHWDGSMWSSVTSPTTIELTDIKMISATDGWAVGFRNSLVLHWDGSSWSPVTLPVTSSTLYKVAVGSANDVWTIGFDNGFDVIYHWDGSNWIASYGGAKYLSLRGVAVTPGTGGAEAWVVGQNGSIMRWNGSVWSLFNDPYTKSYYDVDLLSATEGWMVGTGWPVAGGTAYEWDGITWAPTEPFNAYDADFISTAEGIRGWAGGVWGEIYYWNGSAWEEKTSPVEINIQEMEILTQEDVWAVGGGNDPNNSYQIRGTILHLESGFWVEKSNPTPNIILSDIVMLSSTEGWAVGEEGTILRYEGGSWQVFTSPVTTDLNAIQMLDSSNGWIVGSGGTILNWNGGYWETFLSPTSAHLFDALFFDDHSGWAVGNTILYWDGTEWSEIVNFPASNRLYAVAGLSPYELWAVGASGTILHYYFAPTLSINYTSGAAGSYFTVLGEGFPENTQVDITVNQILVGQVTSDANGDFEITFTTTLAEEGYYTVVASVNPSAEVQFRIDNDEPIRPEEGAGTIFSIPVDIGNDLVFLPALMK